MARTLSLTSYSIILGLVAAVGPFAIDMYLPAMPAIGADLGASMQAVQWTIVAYFIAFGLAQLVYGPWADQAGRKPPLYLGPGAVHGGHGALRAGAEHRLADRWAGDPGAWAGRPTWSCLRAVIRDLATGPAATRMMSTIMIVIAVSPLLAPLSGSALLTFGTWRLIFWALLRRGGAELFPDPLCTARDACPGEPPAVRRGTMRVGVAALLR